MNKIKTVGKFFDCEENSMSFTTTEVHDKNRQVTQKVIYQ